MIKRRRDWGGEIEASGFRTRSSRVLPLTRAFWSALTKKKNNWLLAVYNLGAVSGFLIRNSKKCEGVCFVVFSLKLPLLHSWCFVFFYCSCVFLPNNGAFFVNYLITSALIGTALELCRFPELVSYAGNMACARNEGEKRLARKVRKNSSSWESKVKTFFPTENQLAGKTADISRSR